MSRYSELLKDPRWQRKRLEVMQRDDFACRLCNDKTKTLHVHHKRYVWRRDPWEYHADELETVCETCHERAEYHRQSLSDAIGKLPLEHAEQALGYMHGLIMQGVYEREGRTLEFSLLSDPYLKGLAQAFDLKGATLIRKADAGELTMDSEFLRDLSMEQYDEDLREHEERQARVLEHEKEAT